MRFLIDAQLPRRLVKPFPVKPGSRPSTPLTCGLGIALLTLKSMTFRFANNTSWSRKMLTS